MLKIPYNYNTIATGIQLRDESKLSESQAILWASPHCLTGSPVRLSPSPAIDFVHWFLLKRILSSRVDYRFNIFRRTANIFRRFFISSRLSTHAGKAPNSSGVSQSARLKHGIITARCKLAAGRHGALRSCTCPVSGAGQPAEMDPRLPVQCTNYKCKIFCFSSSISELSCFARCNEYDGGRYPIS
jgi:hypothetical protein